MRRKVVLMIILLTSFTALKLAAQQRGLKFGKYELGNRLNDYDECKNVALRMLENGKVQCNQEHYYYRFKGKSVTESALTFNEFGELIQIEYTIPIIATDKQAVSEQFDSILSDFEAEYGTFANQSDNPPFYVNQLRVDNKVLVMALASAYWDPNNRTIAIDKREGFHPIAVFNVYIAQDEVD